MGDSLRTRISAIMEAHDVNSDCGCPGLITNWFDHMADAVIRELALTEEHSEWPFDGKHRYVTEWRTDA